jgi:hypothetical protein
MANNPQAYTEAEKERVALLVTEGLPNTWIAEDIDRSIKSVQKKAALVDGAAQRNFDWAHVWPHIMHNDDLLRLHRQIAPQGDRYAW